MIETSATTRQEDSPAPARASEGWPRLGFGVSGPHGSRLVGRVQTRALIVEAVRLGIDHIDTAPAYGAGEAENRVGDGLRAIRDAGLALPRVSTKTGLWSLPGGRKVRQFSFGAIERGLDESLSRLGVTHLDLLILHGPSAGELTDDLLAGLGALKRSGRVKALGAACRGPEADAVTGSRVFDALMLPLVPRLGAAGALEAADPHSLARALRASRAGLSVLAIEVMSGARNLSGTTMGGMYRLARRIARREQAPEGRYSASDALQWAWSTTPLTSVVTTTTRLRHLRANAGSVPTRSPDAH